jgi:hypothetical protein
VPGASLQQLLARAPGLRGLALSDMRSVPAAQQLLLEEQLGERC